MRFRKILIYALILAFVAGYYYYFEVYKRKQEQLKQASQSKVFTLDKEVIDRITLKTKDNIILIKEDNTWNITSPIEVEADQARVGDVLSVLVNLESQRSIGPSGNLADFGLVDPVVTVQFSAGPAEYFIHVGSQTPTMRFRYAQSSGRDDIFLINAYDQTSLDKDLFDLRDKSLFRLEYEAIDSITIKREGFLLELDKENDGIWKLRGKEDIRLKNAHINNLIRQLSWLEASSFPEEYAFDPQAVDIAIELRSKNNSQSLKIWDRLSENAAVYAQSDVWRDVVTIPEAFLKTVPKDLKTIMDRSIVSFDVEKAYKLDLEFEGRAYQFQRKENDWYALETKYKDGWEIDSFLFALAGLEYEDELPLLPTNAKPKGRIRIFYKENVEVSDINLYSNYYITLDEKIFSVDDAEMDTLNDSIARICSFTKESE